MTSAHKSHKSLKLEAEPALIAVGSGVEPTTLKEWREAARDCRACPLWKKGTQTVFGRGPEEAKAMFVGEQPGLEEDRAGEPFVGPAGRLLDRALVEAGIHREAIYLTNMVKHFKWEQKGNLHLHSKPNASEVAACRPWLEAELRAIHPQILVLLGATAAQGLLGRDFRVSRQRGQWIDSPLAQKVMATLHPSAILRMPDAQRRHAEMQQFVADLKQVAKALRKMR